MAHLHDLEIDGYLKSCVIIDRMDLDEEFMRLPADLAYWNERFARALEVELNLEIEKKRIFAGLIIEHRERLLAAGDKATVDAVKAAAQDDERWQRTHENSVRAEVARVRVRGVVEAVLAKKEMLQSLGAKLRAEMTDPLVRREVSASRFRDGGDVG